MFLILSFVFTFPLLTNIGRDVPSLTCALLGVQSCGVADRTLMSPRRVDPDRDKVTSTQRSCAKCGGTGQILNPKNPAEVIACPTCNGSGRQGVRRRSAPKLPKLTHPDPSDGNRPVTKKDWHKTLRKTRKTVNAAANTGITLVDMVDARLDMNPDPALTDALDRLRTSVELLQQQDDNWDANTSASDIARVGPEMVTASRQAALDAERATKTIEKQFKNKRNTKDLLRLLNRFLDLLRKLVT